MKLARILYERRGENSTTAPDPVRPWDWTVDLTETKEYCLASDDDRLVTCRRWQIRDVPLPDWLPPEEFCADAVWWEQLWGYGAPLEWPEAWQRGLLRFAPEHAVACVKLLKTERFRSGFRADLHHQLQLWLVSTQRPASPFSRKQWDSLLDKWTLRSARHLAESAYHARRYRASGREVPLDELAKR